MKNGFRFSLIPFTLGYCQENNKKNVCTFVMHNTVYDGKRNMLIDTANNVLGYTRKRKSNYINEGFRQSDR